MPFWKLLVSCIIAFSPLIATELHEFHLCTVATFWHPNLDKLIASCKKHHFDLDILGMGEHYFGNGTKFIYMNEYLKKFRDDEIVMFVDAFDVIIIADKKTILKKFLKKDARFVMAAEKNCVPFGELKNEYPRSPTPFKYVNTGTYIGYVKDLKAWLDAMQPIKANECDQGQATLQFIKNPNNRFFILDYNCDLFFPLYWVETSEVDIDLKNKKVTCLPTGSHPCVLHANGASFGIWRKVYSKFIANEKNIGRGNSR